MTTQPLLQLIEDYKTITQTLSKQSPPEATLVLECLLKRDKISQVIGSQQISNLELVPLLAEGDQTLKKLSGPISRLKDVSLWRESLDPPTQAWWWHLSEPTLKKASIFDKYDWVWNTLNIAVLTIILALILDIIPRFFSGGTDTAGAFAVVIQSVLAMLTAGGILTKAGSEALERIFKSLNLPPYVWQEFRFGLTAFSLILIILFRSYGLLWAVNLYHNRGQVFYEKGNLIQAQSYYERALAVNPRPDNLAVLEIRYDMGRLFERLQDFSKAKAQYQISVQGGYIPAYNRLARLKILVDKRYDEAVFLLLNGLQQLPNNQTLKEDKTQYTDLLYEMEKNLGWARLNQTRYREARARLEQAIDLKTEEAPAHCLLAQVLDALDKEQGLNNSLEARAEWSRCNELASQLKPDEDGWIYQARLAQLRPITITATTAQTTNQTTSNTTSSPIKEGQGFHVLIAAQDTVKLKRQQWSAYYTVTVGTILNQGDQLAPAENARAIVLCADLTTWPVPGGVTSGVTNGCASFSQPVLRHQTITPTTTYLETNPNIPYIISPRNTQILTTTPTFYWNRVPGVVTYSLSLYDDELLWQTVALEPGLKYTGDISLEMGQTYWFSVTASNGTTSYQDNEEMLFFSVLDETESQTISTQITALGLSGDAKTLALAQIYLNYNLLDEALGTLRPLIIAGSQSTAVHHTLGDVYYRLGLSLLAEERYQRALQLAIRVQDIDGQAAAHIGLANIYQSLQDTRNAIQQLTAAQAIYKTLGDLGRVADIENRLTQLRE